ncbi:MAG: hypothetical protein NT007_03695 [Candidatus Kapabacteria bacterium]|nr:hypothetical protein [Candidatus Kapabacteria bacterium]
MANNSDIMRNYRIPDGELALFTNSLTIAMTRDLTELTDYGITSTKITALTTLCTAFQALPDDSIYRTDLSDAVEQRDTAKNAVLNIMRSISVRAKAVFGDNSAKYRSMSPGNISKFNDSELLVSARQVHGAALTNVTALTPEGITSTYLTAFNADITTFETSLITIAERRITRDDSSEARVVTGNELYALVAKYCDYGKTIWDGVSPSKYNDYVIYGGSSSGLGAPTGFDGIFGLVPAPHIDMTWGSVTGATNYDIFYSQVELGQPAGTYSLQQNIASAPATMTPLPDKQYYFYVVAKNSTVTSGHSTVVSVNTVISV